MEQSDIDRIALAVCDQMQHRKQEWWVEPEEHYNQHKEIAALVLDYKTVKSLFWKAFLGCAITGASIIAAIGFSIANVAKYFPK